MDRFDEVEALDTDALRRLLTEGTERERVWAAWALGLRLGTQARPDLARASRREPDPGARRHLAVLLAGYRDLDLLAVMARHDPDGYVRASACQYLASVAPDAPAVRALLQERLDDPFPAVRSAIVQHLPVLGAEDLAWVARAAADGDVEVRAAALDALSRLGAPAAPVLRDRFRVEPDARLRETLLRRWSAVEDPLALLEDCGRLSTERAREVLVLLASQEHTFDWERLAPLASRWESVLDVVVLRCLRRQDAPAEAREWWADLLLRGYHPSATHATGDAAWVALRFLVEALRPLRLEDLGLREREGLGRVREYLEDACSPEPDAEDSDEEEEDLYEDEEGWGPQPARELLDWLRRHGR